MFKKRKDSLREYPFEVANQFYLDGIMESTTLTREFVVIM